MIIAKLCDIAPLHLAMQGDVHKLAVHSINLSLTPKPWTQKNIYIKLFDSLQMQFDKVDNAQEWFDSMMCAAVSSLGRN